MEPACSKACPTDSIQFGTIRELRETRQASASHQLQQGGEKRAYLYGADEKMLGGLNSFYLLVDKPEVYGLPPDPKMPTRNLASGSLVLRLGRRSGRLDGRHQFSQSRRAGREAGGAAMNTVPSSTYFTVAAGLGLADCFLLLFRRTRGRMLFPGGAHRFLRTRPKTARWRAWAITSRSRAS